MMMVVRKKQLIIVALAIVIGTAGYFNARNDSKDTGQKYLGEAQLVDSKGVEEADFFSQARIDREAGRSKSIETLNALIENESADSESKSAAQQGMLLLAQNTETETAIENLLRAKGFDDAVCYINNNLANVVVKTDSLDSANTAKISEIVTEQSGISQDKIKIMEMN